MKKRSPWLLGVLLVLVAFVYLFQTRKNVRQSGGDEFDRSDTRLILTKHAKCRMDCRHIDQQEITEILKTGKINYSKSEPDGKPDPKYALEGPTRDGQQVRIVFAPSSKGMVVITVIDLNQEWQCNCK